jgi:hypothetical protein
VPAAVTTRFLIIVSPLTIVPDRDDARGAFRFSSSSTSLSARPFVDTITG